MWIKNEIRKWQEYLKGHDKEFNKLSLKEMEDRFNEVSDFIRLPPPLALGLRIMRQQMKMQRDAYKGGPSYEERFSALDEDLQYSTKSRLLNYAYRWIKDYYGDLGTWCDEWVWPEEVVYEEDDDDDDDDDEDLTDYYGSDGMNREDYPSPYDETFGDDIDPCGNIEW